jgi:AcrR family transcriptional regulator
MARPPTPILSTEIIVSAAIATGGRSGQFTMREIAQQLGVKQASLYNHIGSKSELVGLMRDRIHEKMAVKVDVNGNWKDTIRLIADAHRTLLIDHPWLITELAKTPAALGAAITSIENLATVLRRAGFTSLSVRSIIGSLDLLVIGASIDWFAPAELFPAFVIHGSTDLAQAMGAEPKDTNRADAVYRDTLDLLVEALEQRLYAGEQGG